jgi:hypothetical protein
MVRPPEMIERLAVFTSEMKKIGYNMRREVKLKNAEAGIGQVEPASGSWQEGRWHAPIVIIFP